MKNTVLVFFTILLNSNLGFTQLENSIIPSKSIEEGNIRPFIDSLKQKVLSDTIQFNRKDLIHINGRTKNRNHYSMLITVNMKYSYRLDIVEGHLVNEFANEILKGENIKSINYIKKEHVPILGGFMAKGGWILINLKPKVKVDFAVGGLKYHKGKKRKGGNNFLQRKKGELMIRT
ncbi:hypothetical protein [Flagellimonas allohymeniacidonis]|uniref:Uncharacterized protein n=1 Tax=Flagellimonas allohymeniacidonis TaxID=2517819 RepID=A0A4Q8QBD3_9FLAO|nr:hypothetical protein [Allomuricauda hymeniacidonis]TAI47601.1 hypothetical protein EW142_13125 [Allomuricauda hymeniacidonis]